MDRQIPTLREGTWTISLYWSLVMIVTMAGQPARMSSRLYSTSQARTSTYESGCSHRASRPPLVPPAQDTKSRRNSRSLEWQLLTKFLPLKMLPLYSNGSSLSLNVSLGMHLKLLLLQFLLL